MQQKLINLLIQDKHMQGEGYKIKGYSDVKSGNIAITIYFTDKRIGKLLKQENIPKIIHRAAPSGIKLQLFTAKSTFVQIALQSYDASQQTLLKLMDSVKQRIQSGLKSILNIQR